MPAIVSGQPPVLVHVDGPTPVVISPQPATTVSIVPTSGTVVRVPGGPVVCADVREVVITVNDGPPGPPGPPGVGGGALVVPVGEPISAGRAVTIEDDTAWLYDATDLGMYGRLAGISATAASTIGNDITVVPAGVIEGMSGLTPDARYYANGAAGQLGTVPGSVLVAPVGYAVDADTLFVAIDTQLERA